MRSNPHHVKGNQYYLLCPNGEGAYRVAEVIGDYFYRDGPQEHFLRHCRSVRKEDMSEVLKRSSCHSYRNLVDEINFL